MSVYRKITTNEIQAVGSVIKDKDAIKILKQIRDNVITEEDTKGKRKGNDLFSFVGFAHQDDILGGEDADPESEEYKNKAGSVKRLVDAGLILEGAHIPLERGSEKKFGDVHVPSQERIAKYKITEEGLTLLSVLGEEEKEEEQEASSNKKSSSSSSSSNNVIPDNKSKQKSKAVEQFKKDVKEENKL